MARERSEREFHTRLGWWMMTHPRGGAVVIGTIALVGFVADLAYVAVGRHGLDTSFHRWFLAGVVAMVLLTLIANRLGVAEPLGTDRVAARRRARRISRLHPLMPLLAVIAGFVFGTGVLAGLILGCIIFPFGLFIVSSASEIVHPHVMSPRTRA
jgi:hypothetical protein